MDSFSKDAHATCSLLEMPYSLGFPQVEVVVNVSVSGAEQCLVAECVPWYLWGAGQCEAPATLLAGFLAGRQLKKHRFQREHVRAQR